jgi:hypothetical protein
LSKNKSTFGKKVSNRCGAKTGFCDVTVVVHIFIDGVVREVYSRVMEKCVSLVSDDDRAWQLNLYADDTALVSDNESKLQSSHGAW